ncbi:MAG: hypothetical protein AAB019_07365 [Planctomycetota bacterium]
MIKFRYLSSFNRSFKELSGEKQKQAQAAVESLLDFYDTGLRPPGLGLKKLRRSYWEIRAGLDIRIIFMLEKETVTFVLTGTHNDIRRFLKII